MNVAHFVLLLSADPELILHNGTIWAGGERARIVEAVSIENGRFRAVGSNKEILATRGKGTRVIDLKGAFAMPGFSDNHVHFASAAQFHEFNIMNVSSQREFAERVKNVVAVLDKGEWITGGLWGAYDQWVGGSAGGARREPFAPDMSAVESLTRDHPMFIRKFDNSEYAANTAAMRAASLDPANPKAEGVEFLGNGRMRGRGVERLFAGKAPRRASHKRRMEQTRRALEMVRRAGVTNFSDMSDDEQLEIYGELRQKNELTARVHFRYPLDRWRDVAGRKGDEWIRLGSLKGHIDGIMGTSSARFFEPYSNDPANRGRWRPLMVDSSGNFVEGKFLGYMLDADRAGLQLTVHAIGDEANHVLLNYLEELEKRNGKRDRRFRLVHAQVIAAKDFPRFAKLGVIAEVQPFHLSDDLRWMEERIGRERCRGAYAFKSLRASGARLSFGTDWPGTSAAEYPIYPMLGLYAAVTRQTITGEPETGWFPDERLGIEEALIAYTYGTAYANFEEKEKGSIEIGKLADMAVLSKNVLKIAPKELLSTEALYTIVGGRVVWEKGAR